jgi:hypothetical protein
MVRIWVRMHHWRLPSHVGDDLRVSTPARLDLLKICEHFDQVDWAHVCHVQAVEDRRLIGAHHLDGGFIEKRDRSHYADRWPKPI